MISDRDVAFYHEHGYLVVPRVLERSSIETLRQELDAIVEGAHAASRPTRMPTISIYENQSDASRRYFGVAQESADAARTRRSRVVS